MRKIFLAAAMLSTLAFNACDPNKDIYKDLDEAKKPYYETDVKYTFTTADYNLSGNATVKKYAAFNDTLPPENFIPAMLTAKFPALNFGSTISITYNYTPLHPSYLDAMFGYQLTTADYNSFGNSTIATNQSFTSGATSTAYIPGFLLTKYPTKVAGDTVNILLRYNFADNLERYAFNGTVWTRASYTSDNTMFGFALVDADYLSIGGTVATNKYFSSTDPSSNYLPQFLKTRYPYLQAGASKIVKFKYGNVNTDKIEQYTYDGSVWKVTPSTISITDPYYRGTEGWQYNPAVHFTPTGPDLQLLVNYVYATYGSQYGSYHLNDEFYFGASAYYVNFDLRLSTRTQYNIPGFETGTTDEKIALTWNRLQEGLSILLSLKYPDATPEVNGITVYYWVTFKTYENDLSKNTYVGIFTVDTTTGSPVFTRNTAEEDAEVANGALTATQVGWNRP